MPIFRLMAASVAILLLIGFTIQGNESTAGSSPAGGADAMPEARTTAGHQSGSLMPVGFQSHPATPREGRVPLDDVKKALAGQGRGLSELTHEELGMLATSPGGLWNNLGNREYVTRIGISVFIIDMPLIVGTVIAASLIVVLFFTPFGLWLGRGRIHALVGSLLMHTGLAPDFGEHLRVKPRQHLQRTSGNVRRAFAIYMHAEFIPLYKNNITAVAFIGTAFLIFNIGLRGIKFMVAHQPDLIIIAILVEITVLCLLGLTTWYEKQDIPAVETVAVPATDPSSKISFETIVEWLLENDPDTVLAVMERRGTTAGGPRS